MQGLVDFAETRLGVNLYPNQAALLDAWGASGKRKAVLCLGRRSGKGLMAAVAAIHNACVADYSAYLRPGEQRFIVCVAVRQEQAREFVRVVRELLASAIDSDLAALVDAERSTQDEIIFHSGVTLRAMPCSARSTRGLAISLLVMDEAAHMASETDGFAAAKRVYQALIPSTSQFGEMGYAMLTSSPLWPSGLFHELFMAGESGTAPDVFTAQYPTWEMNPSITRESLDFEFLSDPESAEVEYGAQFARGGGAYLEAVNVAACVVPGRKLLHPMPRTRYVGAIDAGFAAGGDAFTFCLGHHDQQETIVIDRLESWRGKSSPLNSDAVLDEIADLARGYGVFELIADQYCLVPISDGLLRRGIVVKAQPLTSELKASIFGSLKRAINLGKIELLDDPQTVSELNHLELRKSPAGKPRIAGAGSFKDDRAMALATVVHAIEGRVLNPVVGFTADYTMWSDGTITYGDEKHKPSPPPWANDPLVF